MNALGLKGEWRAESMGVGWHCKYPCKVRDGFLTYRDSLPDTANQALAWHCARCAKVRTVLIKER